MLRMTLDSAPGPDNRPVAELVSDLLLCHARIEPVASPGRDRPRGDAADRVGDALAFDAALVRLCDRLDIEHDLTDGSPAPDARTVAESRLAARLPSIAAALSGSINQHAVTET
jgi:hypothetical protein